VRCKMDPSFPSPPSHTYLIRVCIADKWAHPFQKLYPRPWSDVPADEPR
jgi:hypothetical protein